MMRGEESWNTNLNRVLMFVMFILQFTTIRGERREERGTRRGYEIRE